MLVSHLAADPVRITNFVLAGVAILLTCFRLWDRTRLNRVWWDDVWAAITMAFLVLFMSLIEVHLEAPSKHSMHVKVAVAYIIPEAFYVVNWAARMSILMTIVRISVGKLRLVLRGVAFLFGLIWLILFAQVWWVCVPNQKWKKSPLPQCPLGTSVAVAQVITDVISDAILILAPIHLAWRTNLTYPQKIRVTAIFSTTLITTAISLNHAYFILRWGGLQVALAAILQCNVSLIVANLSVIIAFLFRIHTEDSEDDDPPVRTFNLGAARSLFLWAAQGQAPITSTFMTAGGVIRERKDVEKSRVVVADTPAINLEPAIVQVPPPQQPESSSESVVNK